MQEESSWHGRLSQPIFLKHLNKTHQGALGAMAQFIRERERKRKRENTITTQKQRIERKRKDMYA